MVRGYKIRRNFYCRDVLKVENICKIAVFLKKRVKNAKKTTWSKKEINRIKIGIENMFLLYYNV